MLSGSRSARGVQRSRVSGRPATDDDHVLDSLFSHARTSRACLYFTLYSISRTPLFLPLMRQRQQP